MKIGDKAILKFLKDEENPVKVLEQQIIMSENDNTKVRYRVKTRSGIKFWINAYDAEKMAEKPQNVIDQFTLFDNF